MEYYSAIKKIEIKKEDSEDVLYIVPTWENLQAIFNEKCKMQSSMHYLSATFCVIKRKKNTYKYLLAYT